jgi:hypothetical protein
MWRVERFYAPLRSQQSDLAHTDQFIWTGVERMYGEVVVVVVLAGHTYTKKLQPFESLAWYDRHKLHLAQESYLGRGQPRRKRESHFATRQVLSIEFGDVY